MRRLIPLFALLCLAVPANAALSVVHRYDQTSIGTITSTTSGNDFIAVTDSTTDGTSLQFGGGGTFTKVLCIPVTTISHLCAFYFHNIAGSKTSVSCTGCGTVNAWHAREISGADMSNGFADVAACYANGAVCNSPANALPFNPGYSAELELYAGNCTGSAASLTGSVTWNPASSFPNGEPGGDTITSSTTQITAKPDSGCGGNSGLIMGVKGSGATQSCTANISYFDYGTAKAGNSPTVAATLLKTGDIVTISGWAITTATAGAMSVGTDSATQLIAGNSDATDGQPWIYADLNSGVSGANTITFTTTGSPTQTQVSYREWVPTTGCTPSLDVTAGPTNGTGTAVNTPSITPSAGDLVLNFTPVESHTTTVNSPWLCDEYLGSGETGSCFFVTTVNGFPYITGAAASSTANNLTQLTSNTWQGIMAAIKFTGSGGAVVRHRAWVIQ